MFPAWPAGRQAKKDIKDRKDDKDVDDTLVLAVLTVLDARRPGKAVLQILVRRGGLGILGRFVALLLFLLLLLGRVDLGLLVGGQQAHDLLMQFFFQ